MAHRFRSFDGVEIAYQRWGTPDDTPPVVLHHGFVVDATTNFVGPGVVAALTDAGRWVVAPDARGHGASGKPHEPARYGEVAMARDLAALVDLLDVDRIDLVGYSMGAVVSALLASTDRRVRRLVLGGVGSAVVELGGLDTRAMPPGEVTRALLAEDPADIAALPGAPFRILADAVGADRLALAAQVAAVRTGRIPLDRITAPTLVLCGVEDHLASRPEVLADAITDGKLLVLPGDHLGVVRDPGFALAIVDFLGA
ncbi:alpha/beta fold hydrolase [Micromonospora sp. NBC_01796]|uniref:alpha/beta fold hydrolase n=1 Tax=Micromonospora sp. NBC_01796 TaxID=2975987 RepID=UPI002DD9D29F|nr:alpha/beta fold hydrolase [Micromonospora sp. NBC_01796]WSA84733.1 alpha/beta hydrolase [Micromonospora sp. NBC_01796]